MEPTIPEIIKAYLDTEATIENLHRQLQTLRQIQNERSKKIRAEIARLDSVFALEVNDELHLVEILEGDVVISPLPKIN